MSTVCRSGYPSRPKFATSRSAMSRSRSLYVGTRSSHPSGVIIPRSSASSATCGSWDCRYSTDRSGSIPDFAHDVAMIAPGSSGPGSRPFGLATSEEVQGELAVQPRRRIAESAGEGRQESDRERAEEEQDHEDDEREVPVEVAERLGRVRWERERQHPRSVEAGDRQQVEDREGHAPVAESEHDPVGLDGQPGEPDEEAGRDAEGERRDRPGSRDEDHVADPTVEPRRVDRGRLPVRGRDEEGLHRPEDGDEPRQDAAPERIEPRRRFPRKATPQSWGGVPERHRRARSRVFAQTHPHEEGREHVDGEPEPEPREVPEREYQAHLSPRGGNQPWISGGGSAGRSVTVRAARILFAAASAASSLRAWISPIGPPASIRSPIFGRKTIPTAGSTCSRLCIRPAPSALLAI